MGKKALQWSANLTAYALGAVVLAVFGAAGSWHGVPLSILVIAVVTGIDRRLRKRFESCRPVWWDVLVDGRKEGTVSDAVYAHLQRRVLGDGRTLLAQAMAIGKVAWDMAVDVLLKVPVFCFWCGVAMVVFAPQPSMEIVDALRAAEASQIAQPVTTLIALACVVTFSVRMMLWTPLTFRNCYADTLDRMLRVHCGISTAGTIVVVRSVPEAAATVAKP